VGFTLDPLATRNDYDDSYARPRAFFPGVPVIAVTAVKQRVNPALSELPGGLWRAVIDAGGSWLTALTKSTGLAGNSMAPSGSVASIILTGNSLWNNVSLSTLWPITRHREASRFLEFRKMWWGHADLSAEEMQWIVDELLSATGK